MFFLRAQGCEITLAPFRILLKVDPAFPEHRKQNRDANESRQDIPASESFVHAPEPNGTKSDAHQEKTERMKAADEPMQVNISSAQHGEQNAPCRPAAKHQEPKKGTKERESVGGRRAFGTRTGLQCAPPDSYDTDDSSE